ncbi:probable dihydroneopterin aldolase [Oceanicola granulosus HTCC2516]|uniref:Probable dihydroneopterin aldolase n=1 Tax=Oceanicola granulosus (strain ATCC BAA-861 / DSM 15982 / KCTC 12143 / HTCC2516) TaxID=314256 RepID=Q2CBF4_OCEGH|nr:dihydroneopterin aldolase [Oceanicola granulosus]EAR50009.1 probable dihydroneopterin aldolase [Oceanicola granulosus HTCC2516]
MSDEIRQAFGHPAERAGATADGPLDRISLRDYTVEVEIGAFQAERDMLQRVKFNLVVEVLPTGGDLGDDVDSILSYDRLIEAIDHELAAERLNLLETLAERVAARILAEPLAARVFVRIEKIDRGPFDLGVEIVRSRAGGETATQSEPPRPRVLLLDNALIASDRLAAVLDAESGETPLIVVVGLPDAGRPGSDVEAAQRRIDLLAIEQNAWALAGRERRCVVVGTRTELDWAMRNGQTCVWAPSKMVLDTFVAAPDPADAPALAAWFAEHMHATELVLPRGAAPATSLPVRRLAP